MTQGQPARRRPAPAAICLRKENARGSAAARRGVRLRKTGCRPACAPRAQAFTASMSQTRPAQTHPQQTHTQVSPRRKPACTRVGPRHPHHCHCRAGPKVRDPAIQKPPSGGVSLRKDSGGKHNAHRRGLRAAQTHPKPSFRRLSRRKPGTPESMDLSPCSGAKEKFARRREARAPRTTQQTAVLTENGRCRTLALALTTKRHGPRRRAIHEFLACCSGRLRVVPCSTQRYH